MVPATPSFPSTIEPYASADEQDTCDPTAKPGPIAFSDLLQQTYGRGNWGITRACSQGGRSEHKEGRALDYPFNVNDSTQRAQAQDLLNWLLATDQYGDTHAIARRLGIMYIMWNHQKWRAWARYWAPDSGCTDPTDCHTDHIHFSFSWPGAYKQTSFWSGRRSGSSISGAGRAEVVAKENGSVYEYHNYGFNGDGSVAWGSRRFSDSVSSTVSDDSLYFADLSGDGYSELITKENGVLHAKANWGYDTYGAHKWRTKTPIGYGFTVPNDALYFADPNGDGRCEVIYKKGNGVLDSNKAFSESGQELGATAE